jgi:hypothetical protein
LVDKEAPWIDLLKFRYGSLAANFLYGEGKEELQLSSIWRRDLWRIGSEDIGGWFGNNISNVLGDGKEIGFWKEKWIGMATLRDMYPALYNKSTRQNGTISELGYVGNNGWNWNLVWTDILSAMEEAFAHDLINLLAQVRLPSALADRRRWIPSNVGVFTVKSVYEWLLYLSVVDPLDDDTTASLKKLWKNNVPSKVSIFGWRLLLEKLPTREALIHRGVLNINVDRCCVMCLNMDETLEHVFLNCQVTVAVWSHVLRWLGASYFNASNVQQHMLMFGELIKGKKYKRVTHIIWLATMWCLWRSRNNILFRGVDVNVPSLVDQITYNSWFWFISRVGNNANLAFSVWCINPLNCFQSI